MSIVKFFKFSVVGGINAVVGLSLLFIMLNILEWNLYLVYILVYFIGISISYLLNTKFTFDRKYDVEESKKYILFYIIGLLIGLTILKIVDELLPQINNFIKVILVIPPRTLITYFLINKWVFK